MKLVDIIKGLRPTKAALLRNIRIAGWTMHGVLAFVWVSSLFSSSDAVGAWAQIIGWGYALGVLVAAVALGIIWCIKRSLPLSLVSAIVAACCVLALCTFGVCALSLETPLLSAYTRMQTNLGCAEITLHGQPSHIICDEPGERYFVRGEFAKNVPPKIELAIRMAEDLNENHGVLFVEPGDQIRAILHAGSRGGASNLCEQFTRRLLGIPHQKSGLGRFLGKFKVLSGCLVLRGRISQHDLLAAYASATYLGSVGNADLDGFPVASQAFFGRKMDDLDLTSAVVLASLVQQPARFFPLCRPGEPEEKAEERRERLRARLQRVTANGVRHHLLSQQKADEILATWEGELVSREKMMEVLPPSIRLVREDIRKHVPDRDARFLRVQSSFDPDIQAVAERGLASGLIHIQPLLPPALREQATADISVLDATTGNRVAAVNLTSVATDLGSFVKPIIYALAIERGLLANMGAVIEGERANVALACSHRGPAHFLVSRLSAHSYSNFLALAGFSVINPALVETGDTYLSAADGSGISADLNQAGAALRMFGQKRPGVWVEPNFTPQITDMATGQVLYRSRSRTLLRASAATEVGAALELTGKIGTARAELHDIADSHGIRAKTATPHTMRHGVPVGGGGVFCGAFDRNYLVVVRLRLINGDIPLDGAAGCFIAHDVLQGIYDLKSR
jgi:membrane peptidoglycan carboxypeptidase